MIYKHYFMEGTTYSDEDIKWCMRMRFFRWTPIGKVFTAMKTEIAGENMERYNDVHVRTFNRVF